MMIFRGKGERAMEEWRKGALMGGLWPNEDKKNLFSVSEDGVYRNFYYKSASKSLGQCQKELGVSLLPLFVSLFEINGCDDAVCGVHCNRRLTLFPEKQPWQQKFQSFFPSIWMNKNAYRHAAKAEDKQSYSQSQWKFFKKITDNTSNKNSFTQINNRFSNNFEFFVTHCKKRLSWII